MMTALSAEWLFPKDGLDSGQLPTHIRVDALILHNNSGLHQA
jgi:hypothetical protein